MVHIFKGWGDRGREKLTIYIVETEEDANFGKSITDLLGQGAPPKWKLTQLMEYLSEKEKVDVGELWQKIKAIINLTVLCLCNQNINPNVASSCFELFGFGILSTFF